MSQWQQGWSTTNKEWNARLIVREVDEPGMVYLAVSSLDEHELKGILLTKEQFHELTDLYYRIQFHDAPKEATNVQGE